MQSSPETVKLIAIDYLFQNNAKNFENNLIAFDENMNVITQMNDYTHVTFVKLY
jgi:hypothetical protein